MLSWHYPGMLPAPRHAALLAIFCIPLAFGCTDDGDESGTEAGPTETSAGDGDGDPTGDGDGDPTGDGDGDPTGDGDGDPTGDGDGDPNACPEPFSSDDPNSELPPPFVDCALESPCDKVTVDLDESMTTGGDEDILTPDALDCVLESLDAGAVAEYSFEITSYISAEDLVLRVYAGGRAELSRDAVFDSAWDLDRFPHMIDANKTFADCGGSLSWSDVWPCIQEGLLDCETWGGADELCSP